MIGRFDAFIKTSGFEVDANEFVNTWNRSTPNDGATFDGGGTHGGSSFSPDRQIFWEAHVILAPRNPVSDHGFVRHDRRSSTRPFARSTRTRLRSPARSRSATRSQSATGFPVDDLTNIGGGAGSFNANDQARPGTAQARAAGIIWGNHGLMESGDLEHGHAQNFSTGHSRRTRSTSSGAAPVELDIHVDDPGWGVDTPPNDVSLDENTPGTTFEFDIKHLFSVDADHDLERAPGHVSRRTRMTSSSTGRSTTRSGRRRSGTTAATSSSGPTARARSCGRTSC